MMRAIACERPLHIFLEKDGEAGVQNTRGSALHADDLDSSLIGGIERPSHPVGWCRPRGLGVMRCCKRSNETFADPKRRHNLGGRRRIAAALPQSASCRTGRPLGAAQYGGAGSAARPAGVGTAALSKRLRLGPASGAQPQLARPSRLATSTQPSALAAAGVGPGVPWREFRPAAAPARRRVGGGPRLSVDC